MDRPERKQIRLREYDYSRNGCYFITICTEDRRKILSHVVGAGLCARPEIRLTEIGRVVEKSIAFIDGIDRYRVESFVIMPNHIHLLITIDAGAGGHGDPPLQDVIGRFKSYTTSQYPGRLWQRGFYDHIVRDQADFDTIWHYIDENPDKWMEDQYYAP